MRKKQLIQLLLAFEELSNEINLALKIDLGREEFTSWFLEISTIISQIKFDKDGMSTWAKPSKRDTPLALAPGCSRVIYQPLGVVCVMGAWNFPFVTLFLPVVSAIVAGNCVLLKPSEMSPHCSAVSRKIVENYLDNECIKIVEGGAEISIICSQKKWDKICFTGSSEKGKLVAQAAAKNLVPCLLELGGKWITIVDETANAQLAAYKAVGGRWMNSGQVCICPDYVLIHESKKEEFLKEALDVLKVMFGEDPQKDVFFSRMVNEFHTKRCHDLAQTSGGKILWGGKCDPKDRYIAPTIIDNPKLDSKVMKEEIFGPILPVVTFKEFDEVLRHMNESEKPLAMYYFGNVTGNPNKDILEKEVQAGMMCINDVMVQALNPDLPFGGVGYSGTGAYCGRDGFLNFSNVKAVLSKPALGLKAVNKLIIPPYSESDKKAIKFLMKSQLFQSQVQKFLLLVIFAIIGYYLIIAYLF